MKNFHLMKPNRYQPLFELNLDRFFDDFFKTPFRFNLTSLETLPKVDIYEKDNSVFVKAELPGVKPEEVDISVDGNLLTIQGEKKEESEAKKEDYYSIETHYGKFQRVVELPAEVKAEEAKTDYKNGVLKIELPKAGEERKKKIKINLN